MLPVSSDKISPNVLLVDTTLQFAARRNVPVRYDRDLVQTTLRAMSRVSEIRSRRERVFYKKRMAGNRARALADARRLVAEHGHLLPRMRGSEKRALLEKGVTEEEIAEVEREQALVGKRRTAVFGEEKVRQRLTVDGDIIEVREEATGMTFDDEDEEDDDEMEMD